MSTQSQAPQAQPQVTGGATNSMEAIRADLDKWQRKALARMKTGKGAMVEFESEHIPPSLGAAIAGALEEAQTAEDVKTVFAGTKQTFGAVYP